MWSLHGIPRLGQSLSGVTRAYWGIGEYRQTGAAPLVFPLTSTRYLIEMFSTRASEGGHNLCAEAPACPAAAYLGCKGAAFDVRSAD